MVAIGKTESTTLRELIELHYRDYHLHNDIGLLGGSRTIGLKSSDAITAMYKST